MYRIEISRPAERDLRRLPRPLLERLHERIVSLRTEPRPPGVKKLTGRLEGWRVRVGQCRV